MNNIDDDQETERLIRLISQGDRDAVERLFSHHRAYLRRLIDLRLDAGLRRRIDPSDVIQETQMVANRRIDEFVQRRPASFRLWLRRKALDLETKESVFVPGPTTSPVSFSADGKWGASVHRDGRVSIWDARTGTVKWSQASRNSNLPTAVRFSPSSSELMVAYEGSPIVELFDVNDGNLQEVSVNQEFLRDAKFIDDRTLVVCGGGRKGTIAVELDAPSEQKGDLWLPPTKHVSAFDFSANGKRIALGTEGNAIEVWDLAKERLIWRQLRSRRIRYVHFRQDGQQLVISSDNVVERCDIDDTSNSVLKATSHYYWANCVAVHNNTVVIAGPSRQLLVWTPEDGTTRRLASGDGNWMRSGLLSIWNVAGEDLRLVRDFGHKEMVLCLAISTDSHWLVAGDWSGQMVVYDLRKPAVHTTINAHPMAVQSFALSPDGRTLVSGSYDGSVKFWQVESWRELGETVQPDAVQGLGFVSSNTRGAGLLIGTRPANDAPAKQQVHWANAGGDWGWLRN